MKPIFSFIVLTLGLLSIVQASEKETEITITVDNIPVAEGDLRIGIFKTEDAYREKKQLENSPIVEVEKAGSLTTTLKLEPGTYVIGVVHDVNKNGELDRRKGFNIPIEPFGFSNNPKIMFGPPKFSQCTIEVSEEPSEVKIVLKTK